MQGLDWRKEVTMDNFLMALATLGGFAATILLCLGDLPTATAVFCGSSLLAVLARICQADKIERRRIGE